LQAAVDYIGQLGGGTVLLGAGEYLMRDALHLRSNVTLRGQGQKTILRKCDGFTSALAADADYGDHEVVVQDPAGFEVGMGVTVADERAGGFHLTVATIVAMAGQSLFINGRHQADYMMGRGGLVTSTFPVISGRDVEQVCVEGLSIDGSKAANRMLSGCRGAGIYFHRAQDVEIRDCVVADYNGDGISFQQSADVHVIGCTCRSNTQLGLHPGSGSQRPVIQKCRSIDNGRIGLYFCWRVKQGLAVGNELLGNGQYGISIGHKDTDNLIEDNVIADNGLAGVFFRDEQEPQGAHRNRLLKNTIEDNGNSEEGYGIKIDGETNDLVIRDNRIRNSQPEDAARQRVGIHIGPHAEHILLEGNQIAGHPKADVERQRGG
jgi:hypothetical protein